MRQFTYTTIIISLALTLLPLALRAQTTQELLDRAASSMQICAWNEATKQFKTILKSKPNDTAILCRIAYTLKEGQRPEEAITYYKKIIKLAPNYAMAHFNLSLCHLMLGQFDEGLKELTWCSPDHKKFPLHNWCNADLSGKRIVIRAEWGMGDHIQFIRYAQWLKNRGATIIMQTYQPLVQLLSACPFLDKVVPTGYCFPDHDTQIPLMDLMRALGATIDNIPTKPYIFADPGLIKTWSTKLPTVETKYKHKPFRIGLCWAGRGGQNITKGLRKNIPLEKLAPIAQLPGVKLYSLQKMNNVDELKQISFNVQTFDESFDRDNGRFMDSAAVMKNLDLVLTVDTSIVHLAGALGVRTWVMIPETADWRWFMNRTDSPWYPTVRVFRQPKAGDWDTVVQQIQTELKKIINYNRNPQQIVNQAKKFFNNKMYHKAIAQLKKAYDLDPNNFDIWILLANTYNQIGKPHDAIPWYESYITTRPCTASILRNAGLAFRRAGKYQKAIDLYKKALELDPDNDDAHFGIGKTYLSIGDFERGLPAYEQGRAPQLLNDPSFLHDISQIDGKTILIRPDWGLGDMIQFVRYAKLIKEHGGKVFLLPHKPLDPLLRSCPYVDRVVTANIDGIDKQVCPMSLPHLFNTTMDTIPNEIPYLYADPALVLHWQKKLIHDDKFKIGLCWEGSITNLYPRKDVPLEMFKTIAQIPGVSLYSLQKMNGTQQLDDVSFTIHSFGDDFDISHGRFMDTAAVMKNLDLIISVDTATAHLAGALGVPVWILLPHTPDWRWLTKRNDSPWYSTARLFRQTRAGDWSDPLNEIMHALKKKV